MDKGQIAVDTFNNNYNCAQATFSTFAEELGLDRNTALKIASGFGGGLNDGEVCGAVTGALMAIGLKYGFYQQNDLERKAIANEKAREFIAKFKENNGSIICKEILKYNPSFASDKLKIQELNLFKLICPRMVADAVEIVQGMI